MTVPSAPDVDKHGDSSEAATYALGLMDWDDRREFELVVLDDPDAAKAVWQWEEALSPLAHALKPRRPRKAGWTGLERRLFAPDDRAKVRATRNAAFWRHAAHLFFNIAVLALAALVILAVRPDLLTS